MKINILITILSGLGVLCFLAAALALAEDIDDPVLIPEIPDELPKIPGRLEGTGIYFEITDSEYLNVSLQSSEEITVVLESVPKTMSLNIEASSVVSFTTLTFSNLEPNTTYYKFEDSYENKVEFITDENGEYIFTQDITQPHHTWIQPEDDGTVFLPEDCSAYGIWDEATSTCVLTQDLIESAEITTNDITLDCDSHAVTGNKTGYGVYLNHKSGIKVKNCSISNFSYGIYLYYSSNNAFINNVANLSSIGISLRPYSDNNTLTGNTTSNNSIGAVVVYASNNTLIGNIANSNRYHGITLSFSSNNTLTNNISSDNNAYGLYISSSSGNILSNSKISNNLYNFAVFGNIDSHFNHSIDTTNTVDGKPIYYIVNGVNQVYDNSTNAGIFYCINCNQVTLRDLVLSKNYYGVFFWRTKNSEIENITVSNNRTGILLKFSDTNTLIGNTTSNNKFGIMLDDSHGNTLANNIANLNSFVGIMLDYSDNNILTGNVAERNYPYGIILQDSNNNILTHNTVSKSIAGITLRFSSNNTINSNIVSNNPYGINLYNYSNNNTLTNNTILNNWEGIRIRRYISYNKIYHNNFINNLVRIYVEEIAIGNLFDNGYPDGGNYWSDYIGADQFSGPNQDQPGADGISDTPYTFRGGEDRYPFMEKDGWIPKRIFPDKAAGLAEEVVDAPYLGDGETWGGKGEDCSIWSQHRFMSPTEITTTGYNYWHDGVKNCLPGGKGVDCSGLIFWSYNRAYYNDRVLTKEEFGDRPLFYPGSNGQYIGNIDKELELTKEDLRTGDLLFFDTWNRNIETYGQDGIVDHVAMFIGLYEDEQYAVEHAHLGNDNVNNAGKISVTTVDSLIDYYKGIFGENAFVDFGRVVDAKVAMKFTSHSPIDLIITAPDGETIYANIGAREPIGELGDIGDSLTMSYMVYDIDGDGESDDIVASPERKLGDYLITVVAEPDAPPIDTYSIEMEALINGEIITTVLAEDVPISDIPRTPYIIESTETEIIPIIPAFVDFNPDTLNLKSKGKWVTVYIELPVGYDSNEINLESIRLNGEVPAVNNPKYKFVTDPNSYLVDSDNNGILERMVKFDQSAIQGILEIGDEIEIIITGELTDGSPFQGSDTIGVILKGKEVATILTAVFLASIGLVGLFTYKRKSKHLNGIIKAIKRITNFKGK